MEINKCVKCDYEWMQRAPQPPAVCPRCKTYYWKEPKVFKNKSHELNFKGGNMANISNYTKPAKAYMKAADVIANPTIPFIITAEADIVEKEYKGQKQSKLQVEGEFNKEAKVLELSKTNARTIAKVFGDDTKSWIGKMLVLETYRTKTSDGKMTDAINVKEAK
jgi:hypothetical protein